MAKKRLNIKLLIILASTVAVLAVGLVVATNWYRENAGRAIRRAEAFEAEGRYDLAAGQWEKAFRATKDSQYRLRGVEALSYRTSEASGNEAMQSIYAGLNNLVASDPGDLAAVRPLMRLYAESARLSGGTPGQATREVRRLAGLVLAQQPDDAEARIYQAAATLALSTAVAEQVPAEEVEAARETLRELVVAQPLDGTGIAALLSDFARQSNAADDPAVVMERLLAFRDLLDAAAEATAGMTPRDDSPTDVAAARTTLARAYSALATWSVRLSRAPEVQAAIGEEVAAAVPGELREASIAQSQAALAALDESRDAMADEFVNAHLYRVALLGESRNYDEAEAILQKLSALRPWDPRVAKQHADFLMDRGRPAEAAALLRDLYAKRDEPLPQIPGPPGVTTRQMRTLLGQYLAEAALAEREAATDAAERERLLKEATAALSESTAARRRANVAEQPDTDRVQAQLQIAGGQPYEGLRTLAESLRTSGEGATLDGGRERAQTLRLLASTNRQLNQPGTELDYLDQLWNGGRQFMVFGDFLRYAELLVRDGRREEAEQVATLLNSVAPDHPQVRLLQVAVAPGGDAVAAYEAMPEETESELRAKLQAALNSNRADDAVRLGNRLLELSPDNEQIGVAVAQLLMRAGRTEAAREILGRFPDSEPAGVILDQLDRIAAGETPTFDGIDDPVRRLRIEAQVAASRGDQEQTIAKLEQAAKIAPGDPQIIDPLFRAFLAAGRVEDARPLVPALVTASADGIGGETYRIELLLAEGQNQAAVDAAQTLFGRYQSALPAARLYGDALAAVAGTQGSAERAQQAVDAYERALEIAPQDERSLAGIVAALELAGRAEEAKPYIERGLRVSPRNATLLRAAIGYELRFGDPTRILDVRRQAVEAQPDDGNARQTLVDTLLLAARGAAGQGDADRAREFAREAVDAAAAGLEAVPTEASLVRSLAGAAPLAGDEAVARAKAILEERMTPTSANSLIDDPSAVASAATLYAATGDAAGAETIIRRHLAATPEAPRRQRSAMLSSLSQLLASQGQTLQAIEALDADQGQPAVRAQRIRLLATAAARRDARVPDALDRLRDDIARADANGEELSAATLTTAAAAELDAGDLGRAEALADRAAALEPNRSDTLYIQAVVALRQPEPDLALAEQKLAGAVEANPRYVEALRALAETRFLRGDSDGASDALARLLDERPDDVAARLRLVRVALMRVPPDYAAADEQYRAAEAAGVGSDPQLLISRAQTASRQGNLDSAVDYAQRAAASAARVANPDATDPDPATAPPAYVQALAQLQTQAGRSRDAIALLDRVIAAGTPPATWWARSARGTALASLDRDDEAQAAYEQAYAEAQQAAPAAAEAVLAAAQENAGDDFAQGLIADALAAEDVEPRLLLTASRLAGRAGDLTAAAELVERARTRAGATGELGEGERLAFELQLGTLELQMDPPQLERAMERFRGILQQRPTSQAAANNLAYAITLYVTGGGADGEEAVGLLREADRFGQIALASAEEQARQTGEGVNPNIADSAAWASTLLAIRTDDRAGIEAGLRRLEEVRDRAVATETIFPELHYHIARAHQALGNLVAARTSVQSGMDLLERRARESGGERPADGPTRQRLEALSGELVGESGS